MYSTIIQSLFGTVVHLKSHLFLYSIITFLSLESEIKVVYCFFFAKLYCCGISLRGTFKVQKYLCVQIVCEIKILDANFCHVVSFRRWPRCYYFQRSLKSSLSNNCLLDVFHTCTVIFSRERDSSRRVKIRLETLKKECTCFGSRSFTDVETFGNRSPK